MALIGVLALQGAFREHARALTSLGADVRELRQLPHLDGIDGLVIPGGESTTIGKLLVDLGMMETERLRLLDTFTDGEGEQTTVYGSRRAEWRALC